MAGFSIIEGPAIALPQDNIDTDQLIPARFMSVPRKDGYGPYLLHDLRFDSAGAPRAAMPLNRHTDAEILVTRRNFGSGSSREAAVYALVDFGIKAVIASSFGDIFASNAVNNGLLPARLSEDRIEDLTGWLGEGKATMTVDLEACEIRFGNEVVSFELDPVWRLKLLNGWDDIDMTASHGAAIAAFRAARAQQAPYAMLDAGANGAI
jgi:3-isopropylmalate/(R)-2-methylmalate dehydratase small subunit